MKHFYLFIFFFALSLTGIQVKAQDAQAQQVPVMQDYALLLELSPSSLQKLGEKEVDRKLRETFPQLYAGYVPGKGQFIVRRSAVMASIEPLKTQLTQLYPKETVRNLTNHEFERFEKSLTN